jgi:hypothetical protein
MILLAKVNPKPHPRFFVEKPGEKILEVLLAKIPFPVSDISM